MLSWMEVPLQQDASRDRAYMLGQANKIRRIFYDLYREFEMEVDIEECFQAQDFSHCAGCPPKTSGITLPPYMQTVEAAWASSEPLSLYGKWREYKTGLKCSSDNLRAVYKMPGFYATERDVCPYGAHCVGLMARDVDDKDKKVKVTYRSETGVITEYVSLIFGGYRLLEQMAVEIKEVVLPAGLKGSVVIAQKDGDDKVRILSEYAPHELVPSYRRVKITGVGCDEVVVVRASRCYTDLFYDDDVVETDNRLAIENAARYLFYSESGTGDAILKKAEFHYAKMRDDLKGMNSRELGIAIDGDLVHGPPVRRSKLRSHRRSHRVP